MSTTTTSPSSITRSETSWCGDAAFGPEPTITKSTWTWPSARMASAILAPTWRSVSPGLSQPGTLACTRSIASPASSSAPTSAADLRIRSGDSTVLARCWLASGRCPRTAARAAPTCGRTGRWTAGRRRAGLDHPERERGLPPRHDLQVERAGRRGLRRLQLKLRHQQERVARPRGSPGRSAAPAAWRRSRSRSAGPGPGVSSRASRPSPRHGVRGAGERARPGTGRGLAKVGCPSCDPPWRRWSRVLPFHVTAARKRVSDEPRPSSAPISVSRSWSGGTAGSVPSMSSGSGTSVAVLTTAGAMSR